MKRLAFILAISTLWSCQPEKDTSVIISGVITDAVSETASVIYQDRSNTYTDSLDSNSTFEISFNIDIPTYVNFKHGRESTAMYVNPGDRIQLSINTSEFDETISYQGSDASNYLAKKYLLEELVDFRELYSAEETEFLSLVDETESKMYQLLDSVNDQDFKNIEKQGILLQWASTKLNYKKYYEYLGNGELQLSVGYFGFMNAIDVNDPTFLEDENAYGFLKTYVNANTSDEFEHSLLSNFDFINSTFSNQSTKDKLSYDLLKEYLKNETLNNIEILFEGYKSVQADTLKFNELKDLAVEMSVYNEGKPALDFKYPNTRGDSISLSDFKGSLVYVDVWATWCGPCKREIPHLLELEAAYHNENIVFLSVSVDEEKDYDTWLAMLEEKEMGGVQLFASGWSKITKDYKINGIPRFMLFDSNGDIVNVRAPRPSNPAIRPLIDQYL